MYYNYDKKSPAEVKAFAAGYVNGMQDALGIVPDMLDSAMDNVARAIADMAGTDDPRIELPDDISL